MTSFPITSREYKLTLNVDDKLYKDWKISNFRHLHNLIEWTCKKTNIVISGKFKQCNQFEVKYMDTPDQQLYNNGWIFRIRTYSTEPCNEYTLKFRSPDRYYSACQDITVNSKRFKSISVNSKFEEDITLDPFSSNFSPSCTICSSNELDFKSLDKLALSWEGLNKLNVSMESPIVAVRGKQVIQEVWKGVTIKLGDDDVKIRIVLWWSSRCKTDNNLLFAEIMFRLKSKDETYDTNTITDAHHFYENLNKLGLNTGWVSSDGMTKTKYFYGR
jgi:hypothetical protein